MTDNPAYEYVQDCLCISCGRIKNIMREVWGYQDSQIPKELGGDGPFWMDTIRFGCELCGNKRCSHHNYHGLACTNSNEPGQPGSVYE